MFCFKVRVWFWKPQDIWGEVVLSAGWLAIKVLFCSLAFENLIFPLAEDLIPLAAGQKRLLKAEIFKRFEELVDNLEYKQSEKDTTCADLDGFWDMASFQVCGQDLEWINFRVACFWKWGNSSKMGVVEAA